MKFNKIKDQIKKPKTMIVILMVIIIIVLIIINPFKKEVIFQIKDRCGPIMNMISHTIKDESSCKTQCRSQCEVKELSFKRAEFEFNPLGCNNCTCFCR